MMAVNKFEILKVNLIVLNTSLLDTFEAERNFLTSDRTEVRKESIPFGLHPSDAIRTYEFPKDRIAVQITPDRSILQQEYPTEHDFLSFAQVAAAAFEASGVAEAVDKTFGYNTVMLYEQDSGQPASAYLGQKLFRQTAIDDASLMVGGSGKIMFDAPEGRYTATIEPRHHDQETSTVFLSMNAHKTEMPLPDVPEIMLALERLRDASHLFATNLDKAAP